MGPQPESAAAGTEEAATLSGWLSRSQELFAREWHVWCGQGAVMLTAVLPFLLLSLGYYAWTFNRVWVNTFDGQGADPQAGIERIYSALGWVAASLVPVTLIVTLLTSGILHSAVRASRGEPVAVADLLYGVRRAPQALVTAFVSTLCMLAASLWMLAPLWLLLRGWSLRASVLTALPLLLLVPPGFYILGRLVLAHPFATEGGLGGFAALIASWKATSRAPGRYCLWTALIYLVAGAGAGLGLGMAAAPAACIMLAVSYLHAVGDAASGGEGEAADAPASFIRG